MEHDLIFNKVMTIICGMAHSFRNVLYTIENPSTGVFHMQLQVHDALNEQNSWKLLETDYCKAADPEIDTEHEFSKKPTHVMVHGVLPGAALPQCKNNCSMHLSGKHAHRHRKAVRIDHRSAPGQSHLVSHEQDAILKGLFKTLWGLHLWYHMM